MANKIVRFEFDIDNPPPLTSAQEEELRRLAAMRDQDIDYSDIPHLTEDFGREAVRFRDRHLYRPIKKQVTLRIDADILEWFKGRKEGGRGYQTAINAALRKMVDEAARG